MTRFEGAPLSPLDEEIATLLDRLTALEARDPTPDEKSIREVAMDALRARLRDLSRKCDDKSCRVRVMREVRRALGEG